MGLGNWRRAGAVPDPRDRVGAEQQLGEKQVLGVCVSNVFQSGVALAAFFEWLAGGEGRVESLGVDDVETPTVRIHASQGFLFLVISDHFVR